MTVFASQNLRKLLVTPKTLSELKKLTNLSERTIRYHLKIFREKNILKEIPLFSDLRRKKVVIKKYNK